MFFYYLQHSADTRIEAKIQSINELDKRMITVKIPINLPYQTDWEDFEEVDGEMNIKGVAYKYVKRKIYQDTLILLCINHREKSVIQKNSNDYFKKVNDLVSETSKKPTFKQTKNDFYEEIKSTSIALFALEQHQFNPYQEASRASGYVCTVEMPPDQHS